MPTFLHGKGTQFLVDDSDLSGYFDEATPTSVVETAETTAFGNNSKTFIVGLMDGTIAAKGMFDGSADAVDEELTEILGDSGPHFVTVVPGGLPAAGQTTGMRAISGQMHEVKYEIGALVGDKVSVQAEFQITGGLVHGVVLQPYVSLAATTQGSTVDNAASSAFGGQAVLHAPVNTRNANVTVKVQHSTDASAWVDLITFTAATTTTAERIAVTGTVNRYVRATRTITGTDPSFTYAVAFARR